MPRPREVWHALTDAETLRRWASPATSRPRVGHRFQFRAAPDATSDGMIEAEMISVDAPRQFAFKWLNGPLDEPTTVTVTLDPEADGTVTRFRLSHTDPSGASCMAGARILGRNWGQRLQGRPAPLPGAEAVTRAGGSFRRLVHTLNADTAEAVASAVCVGRKGC